MFKVLSVTDSYLQLACRCRRAGGVLDKLRWTEQPITSHESFKAMK